MIASSLRVSGAALLWAALGCAQADSESPKERAKAVREAAKRGSDAIPELERAALDPDLDVRLEAVKGLVNVGTQKSLDPLIRACGDPDAEMQIRATDGLVNFYLPGYWKSGLSGRLKRAGTAIQGRFTDTNDDVIPGYVQVQRDVVLALARLVKLGATTEVKANAARAAGVLRGKDAVPDLVDALRTKDDLILYESLVALKKIGDPAAGPKIAFLVRDLNDKVQVVAAEAVGTMGYKEAVRDLEEVMGRDRSIRVKRATLTGLALLAQPSSRSYFTQYLADRDEGLRAAAAEGLGRLRNASDTPLLEKGFGDERKAGARLSFAFALVLHGRDGLAEFSPLRLIINTLSNTLNRRVAQSFLIELARGEKVRGALNQTLLNWNKPEKLGLAAVLAVSGDRGSVAPLESLVKDPDAEIGAEASRALRILRDRLR